MRLSAETVSELVEGIHRDGTTSTVEIGVGRAVRMRIEPDDVCNPFDESAIYGNVAPNEDERPSGFDGNAEKVSTGYETFWWQPPDDMKRTDEGFSALRQCVRELLEFGWQSIGLELLEGHDAYGRPVVRDAAWLGGVEPMAEDAYLATLVHDLALELKDTTD